MNETMKCEEEETDVKKKELKQEVDEKMGRNVGVDILRIIMMMGIVTLHFLGHGGLLERASTDGGYYALLWLFRGLACMSVNCFVLITGYFQSKGTFKLQKLIILLAQIVFWSLITYGISVASGTTVFSVKDLIKAFFPFFFGGYWFATVYVVLYALSPFVNKGLSVLNQRQHATLTIVLAFILTFPFLNGVLGVESGYGLLWFVALYIIGAYLRKYGAPRFMNTAVCVALYIVSVLVLWAPQLINLPGVSIVKLFVGGYSSIPNLLAAISCFIIFSRIRVNNTLAKIVAFVSPLTFGVYLIHDSEFFRATLWGWVNTLVAPSFSIVHVWVVPLVVLVIFVVASMADFARIGTFKLIRIEKLAVYISKKVMKNTEEK